MDKERVYKLLMKALSEGGSPEAGLAVERERGERS